MRVFVTGGAGFIGRWVVKRFLDSGNHVTAYDNLVSGDIRNIEEFRNHPSFNFIEGDILDNKRLSKSFKGSDLCIHLAAQIDVQESIDKPRSSVDNNIIGTYNLLELCRENSAKIVVMGTCMVYDMADLQKPISESHPVKPVSPYAASKLAAEELAISYNHAYSLPVVILRPFNTYGPYQKTDIHFGSVINLFISKKLKGQEIGIQGNGDQTRDFLYAEDCAEFIYQSSVNPKAVGHILNAGTCEDIPIKKLASMIMQDSGRIKFVPHRHPQSEIHKLLCDYSKAKSLLGWTPKTDLAEGIKKTELWLKSVGGCYE